LVGTENAAVVSEVYLDNYSIPALAYATSVWVPLESVWLVWTENTTSLTGRVMEIESSLVEVAL